MKVNILRGTSESIMINVSDRNERVELNLSLPGHTIKELEELKSKIEKNGVKVPILVRSIPTGFEVKGSNVLSGKRDKMEIPDNSDCRIL
jgi:MoaA/NifB/PqqE/SkfB family radical SAM enzyme